MTLLSRYEKHFVAMRYWLLGKEYFTALKALEYASSLHTGVRKDGTTREFAHQLSIARYVRSLASVLQHPEDTLAVVFLHDVSEDYGVSLEELTERFSTPVAQAVWALTRKYRGKRIPDERYFAELSAHPIASVVKGADRIHNVQTMLGVFTPEKQRAYVHDTECHVLPMLKHARRQFPRQEAAYENLQHMLVSQIELLSAVLRANEPQPGQGERA
jgi:(p)ppGpp synthase/HD superfamily hydrolase